MKKAKVSDKKKMAKHRCNPDLKTADASDRFEYSKTATRSSLFNLKIRFPQQTTTISDVQIEEVQSGENGATQKSIHTSDAKKQAPKLEFVSFGPPSPK